MNDVSLQVNDLVQLVLGGDRPHRLFPSRVENVSSEGVSLSWPTAEGALIPLAEHEALEVVFVHERTVYVLEAEVRETRRAPIPLILVLPGHPPKPTERRSDLRVRAAVPLVLAEKVVSLSSYRSSRESTLIQTHTTTISAGGFDIRHTSSLPVGMLFDATIQLPDHPEPVNSSARVLRCGRCVELGLPSFEIAFVFCNIREGIRSRIVRFVFRTQIEEFQTEA
jgi:c-di-GMP-binding flagellar brake protein YcgR